MLFQVTIKFFYKVSLPIITAYFSLKWATGLIFLANTIKISSILLRLYVYLKHACKLL